jgi:hypothetical protein
MKKGKEEEISIEGSERKSEISLSLSLSYKGRRDVEKDSVCVY